MFSLEFSKNVASKKKINIVEDTTYLPEVSELQANSFLFNWEVLPNWRYGGSEKFQSLNGFTYFSDLEGIGWLSQIEPVEFCDSHTERFSESGTSGDSP